MITASRSLRLNSGTFRYGYDVLSSTPATFTPQSSITLLFGVCKNRQDRPTSLNPPRDVSLTQSLSNSASLCILFPSLCRNSFLSLLFLLSVNLILCIVSEVIGGVLSIFGAHPVCFTISRDVAPYFPITSPGFLDSIITSHVTSSKDMSVISASFGTISSIFSIVSVGSNSTDLSDLMMILFLISFARSLMMFPLSLIISGFLVYMTISGPSNSTFANFTLSGKRSVIFSVIS